MKSELGMAVAVMAVSSVVALAAASAGDGPEVTVAGCVQNYSAKGTVGTTERGYLLTNVTNEKSGDPLSPAPAPTEATTAPGTPTGTSGTAARAGRSYRLEGHEDDLKDQVGHKVEVVGTVLALVDDDAPKGEEKHLQVASIRLLSSKCSSK